MTIVRFIGADLVSIGEVIGGAGDRLLDLAQNNGQPLEGTCEGQMACSTCHVILAPDDFSKLTPASEMEEDMLDLAVGATRYSRLACQIWLDGTIEQITVHIPAESRNMQGR